MAETKLKHLSSGKQRRLDALMLRNNEGRLTPTEARELRELVGEAENIAVENARNVAEGRRLMSASVRGEAGD